MTETRQRPDVRLPSAKEIENFGSQMRLWFQQNGREFPWRDRSATNYQRIVAEVMLQRTQAGTVARFFPAFVKRYPSWKKLSLASESDLQELFKPIGLWRQKAAGLTKLAAQLAKRSGRFPKERDQIEALPAVGQYIANAVLLFCHGQPQPLLDASMARVLERYFGPRTLVDIRRDPYLQGLARKVVQSVDDPISLNWAMLDLAASICRLRAPRCNDCPVAQGCRFAPK